MHAAKEAGGNRVSRPPPPTHGATPGPPGCSERRAFRRTSAAARRRTAFRLHWQPIVELETGAVTNTTAAADATRTLDRPPWRVSHRARRPSLTARSIAVIRRAIWLLASGPDSVEVNCRSPLSATRAARVASSARSRCRVDPGRLVSRSPNGGDRRHGRQARGFAERLNPLAAASRSTLRRGFSSFHYLNSCPLDYLISTALHPRDRRQPEPTTRGQGDVDLARVMGMKTIASSRGRKTVAQLRPSARLLAGLPPLAARARRFSPSPSGSCAQVARLPARRLPRPPAGRAVLQVGGGDAFDQLAALLVSVIRIARGLRYRGRGESSPSARSRSSLGRSADVTSSCRQSRGAWKRGLRVEGRQHVPASPPRARTRVDGQAVGSREPQIALITPESARDRVRARGVVPDISRLFSPLSRPHRRRARAAPVGSLY